MNQFKKEKGKLYTMDYIYNLPEGERAELINGQIYNMAPPKRIHQEFISFFTKEICNYVDENGGECKVYPAPFAVFLDSDDNTYVEPDISVICDKNKLSEDGCKGSPDWIIEVVSPSSKRMDYYIKLFKYRSAGVREYWIVNSAEQVINVYDFEHEDGGTYTFSDKIKVRIFENLELDISKVDLS